MEDQSCGGGESVKMGEVEPDDHVTLMSLHPLRRVLICDSIFIRVIWVAVSCSMCVCGLKPLQESRRGELRSDLSASWQFELKLTRVVQALCFASMLCICCCVFFF